MSFILDALKKAEADRQRQTGPTLLEVRVSSPRRRFPVWMLIIGGLLGINVVLLAVFLLHRPASEPAPAAAAAPPAPVAGAAPAAQAPPAGPAVPAAAVGAPGYAPAPYVYAPAGAPQPYPQQPYPQQPYPQQTYPPQPAYPQQPYPQQPYAGAPYPAQPYVAQSPAPRSSAIEPGGDNPADYEPAVTPAPAPRPRTSEPKPEPPSLSQIDGNLPELRLDMHVYASRPADRYALINMHRVREGDTLPEGPRVVSIERDGVELNYRGTEFMLHPQ